MTGAAAAAGVVGVGDVGVGGDGVGGSVIPESTWMHRGRVAPCSIPDYLINFYIISSFFYYFLYYFIILLFQSSFRAVIEQL